MIGRNEITECISAEGRGKSLVDLEYNFKLLC